MKTSRNFTANVKATIQTLALGALVIMSGLKLENISVLELKEYTNHVGSISPNYYILPNGTEIKLLAEETKIVEGFDSCVAHEYWDLVGMHKYGTKQIPAKKEQRISFKLSEFTKTEKLTFAVLPIVNLSSKKITMIDLKYPYRKSQIYMGGSTIATMARFLKMGYQVNHINLNVENLDHTFIRKKINETEYFGISVIGAPYIPSAIELARKLSQFRKPILFGGQVIERLEKNQFTALFEGTTAQQIVTDVDLARVLNCSLLEIPDSYAISHMPALEALGKEKLREYMSHEMTMVLSQGCHFQCAFCAASKTQKEKFKSIDCFSADIRFLAKSAKDFGIDTLEFYTTSLDFFQNPKTVFNYLNEIANIQSKYKVKFKIRCLSCVSSFVKAVDTIGKDSFKKLTQKSGLWCIGFGVDGADSGVWKAQKKNQNNMGEIKDCLDLAEYAGIQSEILLVMGFPQDNFKTLLKCVITSFCYVWHWHNTMLRPYLAKELVPGNDGWKSDNPAIKTFITDPKKFYNLDFCALGSKSTDARFWHRMWSNISYLTIIGIFTPFGKCVTSPLLPQGNSGLYGKIAKWFNKIVPFDR